MIISKYSKPNYNNDAHNNSHQRMLIQKEKRFYQNIFILIFNVKIFIYLRFVILLKIIKRVLMNFETIFRKS